jgi:hypothetical protein
MAFAASGAIIAGGLMLGSSVIQSNAAGRAADKAANATDRANQLQSDQFWQTREDNLPLMDLRNALLPRLQDLAQQDTTVTAADVSNDPGYQFGLNERQRLAQNSFAAGNGLYRGSTAKALGRDAQDYGMTRYNDIFNRKQTAVGNAFNRTSTAAGLGQSGVQQTQQAGQNMANNVGQNLLSNANFQGAAGMSQANAWGNLLNRGSSYFMGGM